MFVFCAFSYKTEEVFLLKKRKYVPIFGIIILAILGILGLQISSKLNEDVNESIVEAYVEDGVYIQTIQSYGYNSEVPITLEVRIDMSNDSVSEVSIISHEETQDYGGYITEDWFLDRFFGKSVDQVLKLVKIMPEEDADIVAITGATKTSEGVVNGVNIAMENYNNEYGEEK